MLELTMECRCFHSPGSACSLHHGTQRSSVDAQHQPDSQHALVAKQSHLETGAAVDRGDQRDEAVGGKENVTSALAATCQAHRQSAAQPACSVQAGVDDPARIKRRAGHSSGPIAAAVTQTVLCLKFPTAQPDGQTGRRPFGGTLTASPVRVQVCTSPHRLPRAPRRKLGRAGTHVP